MTRLADLARVVRSKNAGPALLTVDLLFSSAADHQRALSALTPELIARLYGVSERDVRIVPYPPGRAIKVVIPRRIVAGDPGDRDVYGAQQHAPLLELEL